MEFLLGILAGSTLPFQTSINAELRRYVGSSLLAISASFVIAWIFLVSLLAIASGFSFSFSDLQSEPPWIYSGGIFGVIFLVGNIFLLSKLGGTLTVLFPILGQILTGFFIDLFGFFGYEPIPFTANRAFGTLAVIIGTFLATKNSKAKSIRGKTNVRNFSWKLLGIFIGAASAIQTAVNGKLGETLHSPLQASVISFSVGILLLTFLLFTAFAKNFICHKTCVSEKTSENRWWIWTGGILGGIFILANIFLAERIGTGLTVISSLIGMILGGLVIDTFGLFRVPAQKIRVPRILGIFLTLLGIFAIQFDRGIF